MFELFCLATSFLAGSAAGGIFMRFLSSPHKTRAELKNSIQTALLDGKVTSSELKRILKLAKEL